MGVAANIPDVIRTLTKGHRRPQIAKLIPPRNVVQLEGRSNWIMWRQALAGILQSWAEGRLWYLIHDHPATSAENYRYIFSLKDDEPISLEDAIAYRKTDLRAITGILVQMVTVKTSIDIDKFVTDSESNGRDAYVALLRKYGGRGIASLQIAEREMSNFKLNGRSVHDAAQELDLIFSRIFMAGGEAVTELRKVNCILAAFAGTNYEATRAAIQNDLNKGESITYDDVVTRFAGEESLSQLTEASAVSAVRMFPDEQSNNAQRGGGNTGGRSRQNNQRRNGNKNPSRTGVRCWHCNKIGHVIGDCNSRKAGQPPHAQSREAERLKGEQQQHERQIFTAMAARLSHLESQLPRYAPGPIASAPPAQGLTAYMPPPAHAMPSLANRIGDFSGAGWQPPQGHYVAPHDNQLSGYTYGRPQ
ncbi:hypothetical protein V8E36_001646 [Tilletia maclaganii]